VFICGQERILKPGDFMPQEYIEIGSARENNLKNVSLRIPKGKITIFTGVSGSGKSSIVSDTLATEAQRQLYVHPQLFAQVPSARRRRDRKPYHVGDRSTIRAAHVPSALASGKRSAWSPTISST
jgi:ABC-type transport system involved in cytochrome bd biosynthesis fused ATPase/permease subunit